MRPTSASAMDWTYIDFVLAVHDVYAAQPKTDMISNCTSPLFEWVSTCDIRSRMPKCDLPTQPCTSSQWQVSRSIQPAHRLCGKTHACLTKTCLILGSAEVRRQKAGFLSTSAQSDVTFS